jgi:hypothetical protein
MEGSEGCVVYGGAGVLQELIEAEVSARLGAGPWERFEGRSAIGNVLAHVPHGQAEMIAVFVRTIFVQPDIDAFRSLLREVATRLERPLPKATGVLTDAEDEVTAYAASPQHR